MVVPNSTNTFLMYYGGTTRNQGFQCSPYIFIKDGDTYRCLGIVLLGESLPDVIYDKQDFYLIYQDFESNPTHQAWHKCDKLNVMFAEELL